VAPPPTLVTTRSFSPTPSNGENIFGNSDENSGRDGELTDDGNDCSSLSSGANNEDENKEDGYNSDASTLVSEDVEVGLDTSIPTLADDHAKQEELFRSTTNKDKTVALLKSSLNETKKSLESVTKELQISKEQTLELAKKCSLMEAKNLSYSPSTFATDVMDGMCGIEVTEQTNGSLKDDNVKAHPVYSDDTELVSQLATKNAELAMRAAELDDIVERQAHKITLMQKQRTKLNEEKASSELEFMNQLTALSDSNKKVVETYEKQLHEKKNSNVVLRKDIFRMEAKVRVAEKEENDWKKEKQRMEMIRGEEKRKMELFREEEKQKMELIREEEKKKIELEKKRQKEEEINSNDLITIDQENTDEGAKYSTLVSVLEQECDLLQASVTSLTSERETHTKMISELEIKAAKLAELESDVIPNLEIQLESALKALNSLERDAEQNLRKIKTQQGALQRKHAIQQSAAAKREKELLNKVCEVETAKKAFAESFQELIQSKTFKINSLEASIKELKEEILDLRASLELDQIERSASCSGPSYSMPFCGSGDTTGMSTSSFNLLLGTTSPTNTGNPATSFNPSNEVVLLQKQVGQLKVDINRDRVLLCQRDDMIKMFQVKLAERWEATRALEDEVTLLKAHTVIGGGIPTPLTSNMNHASQLPGFDGTFF